jgi:hypothetical protein
MAVIGYLLPEKLDQLPASVDYSLPFYWFETLGILLNTPAPVFLAVPPVSPACGIRVLYENLRQCFSKELFSAPPRRLKHPNAFCN